MAAPIPAPIAQSAPIQAAAVLVETTSTATLEEEEAPDVTGHAAAWEATIVAVNAKKRMLGAFLQACRFDGVSAGQVVLAMDDLHRAVVDEKENRAIILAALAVSFGGTQALRCVPLGEIAPPPLTDLDVRPMIDRAIAWFEGDVIDPNRPGPERNKG